jgi:hypothetical protein
MTRAGQRPNQKLWKLISQFKTYEPSFAPSGTNIKVTFLNFLKPVVGPGQDETGRKNPAWLLEYVGSIMEEIISSCVKNIGMSFFIFFLLFLPSNAKIHSL